MFQNIQPMKLSEIIYATGGKLISGTDDISITSITTNSRKAVEGSLFIPLKGEKADGHTYIDNALSCGASACLTMYDTLYDTNLVKVTDTRLMLSRIAAYYRKKFCFTLIALTGSVGKTTTKEFAANVVRQKKEIIKTDKNYNNDIGMPFTLFKLNDNTEAAVVEMGMSDFGEIELLSKTAVPDIAIITNIGTAHIEFLKSRDGILRAKTEIFKGMNDDGIVILNGDDDKLITLKGKLKQKTIFIGINNTDCDVTATDIHQSEDGIRFLICGKEFSIPLPGIHNVYNALCAYVLGKLLDISDEDIQKGFSAFESDGIRQTIIKKDTYTIINDCYNSNPQSAKSSLDILKSLPAKRKIAVLGDMKELGEKSAALHKEVGEYAIDSGADVIIALGEEAKAIIEGARKKSKKNVEFFHFDTTDEIVSHIKATVMEGDLYLIKGSHSMHMEKISELL